MKTIVIIITIWTLLLQSAFAGKCDWSKDIKREGDKFIYTPYCHNEVGLMVKDIKDYKIQVNELEKTIEMKDLVIEKADERIELWRKQSYNQYERLQKAYKWQDAENKWYFVGGVVLTVLSVWAAGQLRQ